jgi:hypothetical protein
MKKLTFLLICLLITATAIGGEISKTYTFSQPDIEQSGDYQLIRFNDCLNTGYAGEPSLPWFAVKLLLPPGEEAISVTISGKNESGIPGQFTLYPQQASRPISHGGSGLFQINEDVYASKNTYPSKAHGKLSTAYMNGYSVALLNICPLSYIPSEGTLTYFSEITVSIQTEKVRAAEDALEMLSNATSVISRLNNFVQNPEMRDLYSVPETRTDDYQLLIITPEAFEDEYDALTGMYLTRGLKSQITSTEDISTSMTGQDLQEKIRNYIIQEYQSFNVECVILGGDVEHVPYRGFYCYVQSGSGYSDDNIPADLYYSALDGSWNDNGDNLWGEIGEDDLLPEIAVGRMSFSNVGELNAMIHKSTSYQDNPILGELRNPLLAGEHLWDNPLTWGSGYMNLLVGERNDNGYTTIGIPPDQSIDTLYERYQNWGGSTIMAEINEGHSFVHHCGHANSSTVMHLHTSDITNSNFSQVNGIIHNYTFVHSHGCICGAFDDSDCIMEKMVSINNFAAAVVGNSRYGWFNEGQTEGPSAHLHREMVDALYEEKIGRIGAAFVECKIQTASWVNAPGQHEEGALRWNFYDINILGDPTIQLWTDEPFTVDAIFTAPIQVGTSSMDVTVSSAGTPVEGLMCALTMEGVLHGTAITDANGDATIIIDPPIENQGTAQLSISGYNCLTSHYNIAVTPAAGPFIIYHEHTLDDGLGGNNNGLADFGESLLMTVQLANAGAADATNVTAVLSTLDEHVTITDAQGTYGSMTAGSAAGTINDFAFDVDAFIPDQHVVDFILNISGDNKENWTDGFSIVLNAPVLEAGLMSIDDNAGGNGDGFLDPGETAIISIGILNTGHSMAPNTEASLSSGSSWVSFISNNFGIGELLPGINAIASFEISIDEDTPLGTVCTFSFNASSGDYTVAQEYSTTVGVLVEDWENGDFETFNWQFDGDAPWVISTEDPWEGTYCAKSGDINDNQKSELYVTLEVLAAGELSFYRKLSSEPEWDWLKFYIDYDLMGQWSGQLDWEKVSYSVSQGLHTFHWVYEKDVSNSSGDDCAWVDYIVFPAVDIATGIVQAEPNNELNITIRPNPARSVLNIDYTLPLASDVEISLYDFRGQQISIIQNHGRLPAGKYSLSENVSELKAGIYLCRIITSDAVLTKKLIIE